MIYKNIEEAEKYMRVYADSLFCPFASTKCDPLCLMRLELESVYYDGESKTRYCQIECAHFDCKLTPEYHYEENEDA